MKPSVGYGKQSVLPSSKHSGGSCWLIASIPETCSRGGTTTLGQTSTASFVANMLKKRWNTSSFTAYLVRNAGYILASTGLCSGRLDMIKHQKTVHPRKMWMDIFLTSAWSLWKERNNHHFRKIKPSVASWKQRFKLDFDNLRYRVKPSKQHIVSAILGSIQ